MINKFLALPQNLWGKMGQFLLLTPSILAPCQGSIASRSPLRQESLGREETCKCGNSSDSSRGFNSLPVKASHQPEASLALVWETALVKRRQQMLRLCHRVPKCDKPSEPLVLENVGAVRAAPIGQGVAVRPGSESRAKTWDGTDRNL